MVVINGIKEGIGIKIRKKLTGSSAYGVRGYGAFHYGAGANVHGIYRVRHRWGKVIQEKMPFYVPDNPQTDPQQSHRLRYTSIFTEWQGLTDEQKDYYNKLKEPKGMSGYNRFIRICFLDPFWPDCPMPKFLELGDTPASYAGQAGKYVLVNAEEDALEFGRPGWHGSPIRIKLLPADFQTKHNTYNVVLGDYGQHGKSIGSAHAVANIPIPIGFKATKIKIFTQITGYYLFVYECQIDDNTYVQKAAGGSNTELDMTDVEATEDNYLGIRVYTSAGYIYGGYITIEPI